MLTAKADNNVHALLFHDLHPCARRAAPLALQSPAPQQCHDAGRLLEDPDGLMRIPRTVDSEVCGLVCLQSRVSISALVCEMRADHLEFRYVF